MEYADLAEFVAELIVSRHACGPNCWCLKLRDRDDIKRAIRKLECERLSLRT